MGEVSSFSGDREANQLFSIGQDSGVIETHALLTDFYGQYKLNVVTVERLPNARQTRISIQAVSKSYDDENLGYVLDNRNVRRGSHAVIKWTALYKCKLGSWEGPRGLGSNSSRLRTDYIDVFKP